MLGLKKIRERWQTATGVPMILAGIAIVKPAGYGDALLALINRYFELSLPLNGPLWLGLGLIVAGVSLCAWGETRRRAHQIVIAFRHQSLEPFAARFESCCFALQLPRMRDPGYRLRHFDVFQEWHLRSCRRHSTAARIAF